MFFVKRSASCWNVFVMKRERISTRLLEAQNPQTEPARLSVLARSTSAEIGARIAQNPNASFETLSLLAEKYPRQVLQNPSLALFLLENPQVILRFSTTALRAVLWCEDVPISLLRIAIDSADEIVHNIIATCPNTPPDILDTLSSFRDAHTRELVARHPSIDTQTLLRLCTDSGRNVRAAALRRSPSFVAQIAPLVASKEPSEGRYFADNLWIREERFQQRSLIEALFHSGGELALLWVSMSPVAPEEYLREILSRAFKVPNLLSGLLSNPGLPPSLLEEALAAYPDAQRDTALAFQENLPESLRGVVLDYLREMEDDIQMIVSQPVASWVMEAIFATGNMTALIGLAQNSSLPQRYFAPLFANSGSSIIFALAENPATPAEILTKIVTEWAPRTEPQTSFDFTFEHTRSMLQRLIAKNPSAPPELFSLLASSGDVMVKKTLTQNPNLPAQLLTMLASDPSEVVREGCASRPALPSSLCYLLARDPERKVRQKISLREDLPATLAYELYEEEELWPLLARNPQTPAALLEKLAGCYPTFVARNPNAPPAILKGLLHGASDELLDWVARHPNTPIETLKHLSTTKVREVALQHPSLETSWLYQQKFAHSAADIPF
jgi:hypothetical protein